jgi:transcriptional regulator with XRE-family HTH domain
MLNSPSNSTRAVPPTKLKARRLLLGLTQRDVAHATKGRLNRDGVSRIESGEAWPNPLQMQSLAVIYGCSWETICAEAMEAWLGRSGAHS